jgi:glutathione peroxidase
MFCKIEVNGDNMHPIYKYLKINCPEMRTQDSLKNIPWNFAKFLVNREGKILGFYGPKISPNKMISDIEALLK